MSTEYSSSPYSEEQGSYTTTTHIPYIAPPTKLSATPLPESSSSPIHTTSSSTEHAEINQLAATYRLGRVQKTVQNEVLRNLTTGLFFLLVGLLSFLPLYT